MRSSARLLTSPYPFLTYGEGIIFLPLRLHHIQYNTNRAVSSFQKYI